jgi:leader peptidase (prepilin peptidase)/N-methyltransferase
MRLRFRVRDPFTIAGFGIVAVATVVTSLLAAPDARGALGATLSLLMLAVARHDKRHLRIPNELVGVAFVLGLIFTALSEPSAPAQAVGLALLRTAVVAGAFLAVKAGYCRLRGRDGLGLGDVKLAGVAGTWLDWLSIMIAIDIAVVAALISYLIRQYARQRPLRATGLLPFGLYLAPAIWIGWLIETVLFAR